MATTKRKTSKTAAKLSAPDLNLFSGNLLQLVEKLENCSAEHCAFPLNFSKLETKENAIEKIVNGCPDLFNRYQGAAKIANDKNTFAGNSYNMSTEGLYFDIPAFLSNEPEYWYNEDNNTTICPAKDIRLNIFAPYWVTEKSIFAKLIKIVSFIDGLEQSGQRLNIILVITVIGTIEKKEVNKMTFELVIKKDSEPINLQQLVFLIATPALLRFAVIALKLNAGFTGNFITDTDQEKKDIKNDQFIFIPSQGFDLMEKNFKPDNQENFYNNFNPETFYN